MARKTERRMTERQIEETLRTLVKEAGGIAYKFTSPGNSGVPDRIVVLSERRPIFVEVKTAGEMPTPLQRMQIRRLEELGQEVFVMRGLEGLIIFTKAYGLIDTGGINKLRARYDI